MPSPPTFEELVAEGESVPVEGWDFSWFEGRATEECPSWGYSGMVAARMAESAAALDIQTGGGEVLAQIPHPPAVLVATESWPPNVVLARGNMRLLGATVVEVHDDADLPFPVNSFDLIVSRHPTVTRWDEIGRVLRPGGTYLSQQIGAGSVRELTDFMMESSRSTRAGACNERLRRSRQPAWPWSIYARSRCARCSLMSAPLPTSSGKSSGSFRASPLRSIEPNSPNSTTRFRSGGPLPPTPSAF